VVPKLRAEACAAQLAPDDEQAYEAEASIVGKDGAATGKLRALSQGDECIRVDRPRDADIGPAGFQPSPAAQPARMSASSRRIGPRDKSAGSVGRFMTGPVKRASRP
jgi:hypothetical protein